MTTRVYVASSEGETGKSAIALGLLAALSGRAGRVGVFRPVVRDAPGPDYVLDLLLSQLSAPMDPQLARGVSYDDVHHQPDAAMRSIVDRFHSAAAHFDAMLVVGSDFSDVPSPTEFGFNAQVAANLDAPMVLVPSGARRSANDIGTAAEILLAEARAHHAQVLAVIANRVDGDPAEVVAAMRRRAKQLPVFAVPEVPILQAPLVKDLMAACHGRQLYGDPARLAEEATDLIVAAMTMPHVLDRLTASAAVITPGDREDVLLAVLLAHTARTFPSPSAVILNGGFELSSQVRRLIDGLSPQLPVITCGGGTMATASDLSKVRGRLTAQSARKIEAAQQVFADHVDVTMLMDRLGGRPPGVVTPLMFEQHLIDRARAGDVHIVLPEGEDDRILTAACRLLARKVVSLTLLGDPAAISDRAEHMDLDLSSARLLSPNDPELVEQFAGEYARRRAHKGVTLLQARDTVTDVSYFGTMMVLLGMADGMVSGALHTTAHTIRPALEVIRTVDGVSVVSSVFFMCLSDRVLVYGDCAVNPDPDARQLADIAISSAATARRFGVEPRVAMLSYSTGSSGTGADVDKVREATELVRRRAPELPVDGPIQYDAAVDASVAATKVVGVSAVAGRATVFVFPDLNTGNNTYKAVQRSAGAVAIGPVLQGLRRPVNDLSRGAPIGDIINTIAITAIQARG